LTTNTLNEVELKQKCELLELKALEKDNSIKKYKKAIETTSMQINNIKSKLDEVQDYADKQ